MILLEGLYPKTHGLQVMDYLYLTLIERMAIVRK